MHLDVLNTAVWGDVTVSEMRQRAGYGSICLNFSAQKAGAERL